MKKVEVKVVKKEGNKNPVSNNPKVASANSGLEKVVDKVVDTIIKTIEPKKQKKELTITESMLAMKVNEKLDIRSEDGNDMLRIRRTPKGLIYTEFTGINRNSQPTSMSSVAVVI